MANVSRRLVAESNFAEIASCSDLYAPTGSRGTLRHNLRNNTLSGNAVQLALPDDPFVRFIEIRTFLGFEMLWGRRRGCSTIGACRRQLMECPMPQSNDLSRSLVALEQDRVVELVEIEPTISTMHRSAPTRPHRSAFLLCL
jgi:hypothetical protein